MWPPCLAPPPPSLAATTCCSMRAIDARRSSRRHRSSRWHQQQHRVARWNGGLVVRQKANKFMPNYHPNQESTALAEKGLFRGTRLRSLSQRAALLTNFLVSPRKSVSFIQTKRFHLKGPDASPLSTSSNESACTRRPGCMLALIKNRKNYACSCGCVATQVGYCIIIQIAQHSCHRCTNNPWPAQSCPI